MKKFGGPGKLRQKCRMKQCLVLSRVRKRDCDRKPGEEDEDEDEVDDEVDAGHLKRIKSLQPPTEYEDITQQQQQQPLKQDSSSTSSTNNRPTLNSLLEAIKQEANTNAISVDS